MTADPKMKGNGSVSIILLLHICKYYIKEENSNLNMPHLIQKQNLEEVLPKSTIYLET